MKSSFSLLVLTLLVWMISSCVHQNSLARFNHPETGYVVVGLRVLPVQELYSLDIVVSLIRKNVFGLSIYDRGRMSFCNLVGCEKSSYSDGRHAGLVIVKKLPVGEYRLNSVNADLREIDGIARKAAGFGLFDLGAEIDDFHFTVKSGEISYLGNFALNEIIKPKNKLSTERQALVKFTNREKEDYEFAEKKLAMNSSVLKNYFLKNNSGTNSNLILNRRSGRRDRAVTLRSDGPGGIRGFCNWAC